MKIKYKVSTSRKWHIAESESDIGKAIGDLLPSETLEVKLVCDHEKTFVDNGTRICKSCGEQLEVTSWRD